MIYGSKHLLFGYFLRQSCFKGLLQGLLCETGSLPRCLILTNGQDEAVFEFSMTTQPPPRWALRVHSCSDYAHRVPIDLKGMTYIQGI